MNGWCYSGQSGTPNNWYKKESAIRTATLTPYFADSIWVDMWVTPTDTLPASFNPYYGDTTALGKISISRHGVSNLRSKDMNKAKNIVGFADGHAEGVKLNDLLDYKWSLAWK